MLEREVEQRASRLISATTARKLLASRNIRPSRPRVLIAQLILGGEDRHFTADMIHEEAKIFRPRPVMATVYNTLREFASNGLLREVAVYGARLWFDTKIGPHFHIYVEDSDELLDFPEGALPRVEIPSHQGLEIVNVDVVVRVRRTAPGASINAFASPAVGDASATA